MTQQILCNFAGSWHLAAAVLLARLLNQQMAVLKVSEADLLSAGSSSTHPNPAPAAAAAARPTGRGSRLGAPASSSGLVHGPGGMLGFSSGSPGSPAVIALRRMKATVQSLSTAGGQQAGQPLTAGQNLTMLAGGAAAAGVGLVIDGAALAVALQPQHEDDLLALCKECSAVICCRVSPMQKAQVRA